jgi:hypothetical protein
MFGDFFNHSNGSKWWGPAKYAFLISSLMNAVLAIYGYIKAKSNSGLFAVIFLVSTSVIYIKTLTASCLKTSKCGILAALEIAGVLLYIVIIGVAAIYGLEGLLKKGEAFEEDYEEEEL